MGSSSDLSNNSSMDDDGEARSDRDTDKSGRDADAINDLIVDELVAAIDLLEEAHGILSHAGGWYNLVKPNDPAAARVLIKFWFLMNEEWYGQNRGSRKSGVFGLVKETKSIDARDIEVPGDINLDDIPF